MVFWLSTRRENRQSRKIPSNLFFPESWTHITRLHKPKSKSRLTILQHSDSPSTFDYFHPLSLDLYYFHPMSQDLDYFYPMSLDLGYFHPMSLDLNGNTSQNSKVDKVAKRRVINFFPNPEPTSQGFPNPNRKVDDQPSNIPNPFQPLPQLAQLAQFLQFTSNYLNSLN